MFFNFKHGTGFTLHLFNKILLKMHFCFKKFFPYKWNTILHSTSNCKQKLVRAVMNKKIRRLKSGLVKNNEKLDAIFGKVNGIKKTIRRMRQKDRKHRELSLRADEPEKVKTEIRKNKEALKQIISHIEEAKDIVALKS